MGDPESRAVRLLAEYYEMPLAETAEAFRMAIAAFKQAMTEFGIPEHPGGQCPSPGCQCSPLEALVTARAKRVARLLGRRRRRARTSGLIHLEPALPGP